MKKTALFILSFLFALGIYYYNKFESQQVLLLKKDHYQTFIKTPERHIASHDTTNDELVIAKLGPRESAERLKFEKERIDLLAKNYHIRENRILMGDNTQKYSNEFNHLQMQNTINNQWKSLLGSDLLRFQEPETKVIIREELPVIKIFDDHALYLEQVVITYLLKNGEKSSYRALVDSETGLVLETWDRTLNENQRFKKRPNLNPVPMNNVVGY